GRASRTSRTRLVSTTRRDSSPFVSWGAKRMAPWRRSTCSQPGPGFRAASFRCRRRPEGWLQRLFARIEEPRKGSFVQDDSAHVWLSEKLHVRHGVVRQLPTSNGVVEDALEQLHLAVQRGCSRLGRARRGFAEPATPVRLDILQRKGEGALRGEVSE